MAMTSEKRSEYPLCGATRKSGDKCRAFAGQGTEHLGTGRCKYHGGSTASHRQHAAKVEAQRMATMGEPIDVPPHIALKTALNLTAGAVAWLKAMVGALDALDSPEAQALLNLYKDERDRLARVAKACLDSGMKAAEVEATQKQTAMMGELLEAVMARIELTPAQRRQVGPAIREAIPATLGESNGSAGDADAVEPLVLD